MDKNKQERIKKEKTKPNDNIALYPDNPAQKVNKKKQNETM